VKNSLASTPKPLLSVIISARNAEKTLATTLDSVVRPPLFPIEVVIIDDGSEDNTPDIIQWYQKKFPQVLSVTVKDRGLSFARNMGLQLAKGRYGVFLDADDYLDIYSLERVVRVAASADVDMAFFNTLAFSDRLDRDQANTVSKNRYYNRGWAATSSLMSGADLAAQLMESRAYLPSACLYLWRRDFIVANSIRFDNGYPFEDHAFTYRALAAAEKTILLDEKVHFRRVAETSLSSSATALNRTTGYLRAWLSVVSEQPGRSENESAAWALHVMSHLRDQLEKSGQQLTSDEFAGLLDSFGHEAS